MYAISEVMSRDSNGVKRKNIPVLDINNLKSTPKRRNKLVVKSEVPEYV